MLLTVDQFIARVGTAEVEQIAGIGGRFDRAVDHDRVAAELGAASDQVEGYVRTRYPGALNNPPEMLLGFVADIARWRLRAAGGQQSAMAMTIKERYDAAIAALKDIAAGRLVPPGLGSTDAAGDPVAPVAGLDTRVLAVAPPARSGRILEGWR